MGANVLQKLIKEAKENPAGMTSEAAVFVLCEAQILEKNLLLFIIRWK